MRDVRDDKGLDEAVLAGGEGRARVPHVSPEIGARRGEPHMLALQEDAPSGPSPGPVGVGASPRVAPPGSVRGLPGDEGVPGRLPAVQAPVAGRVMPAQKPGRSKQDYGTPWEFIRAVEKRFGELHIDLAASAANTKAPTWYGEDLDSFSVNWGVHSHHRMWLNPPFGRIEPWAFNCEYFSKVLSSSGRIFFLTPASVGSNWFAQYVHRKALVLALSPRLTYEGCDTPYPKDCLLSCYGEDPGFDVWRWKP